jgi:hypothetical protein
MADAAFTADWDLGQLSPTERQLCEAFPRGDVVDVGTGDPEKDNPQQGNKWGNERQVRAEVIAALRH